MSDLLTARDGRHAVGPAGYRDNESMI